MNPPTSIQTDRLHIRSIHPNDHPDLCAVFTDPIAMRYIGDGSTRTPDQVRERMDRMIQLERERSLSFWALELRKPDQTITPPTPPAGTGTVIGDCGLVPIAHTGPEIELGYRLAQRAWNRGYATEAARAVLHHAFTTLNLDRVIAVTSPENYPSQHVLAKIGMTRIGLTDRYYDTTTMLFERSRNAHLNNT